MRAATQLLWPLSPESTQVLQQTQEHQRCAGETAHKNRIFNAEVRKDWVESSGVEAVLRNRSIIIMTIDITLIEQNLFVNDIF